MTNLNKKPQNTPIVLDLNNVDFERGIEGSDIWQQGAVFEFTKRLHKTANQAKEYAKQNNSNSNPIIIHDAIFIGGARGTGKTVFLQNIKGFWQGYEKENNNTPTIHFCNSIDPTLLVDHDNFANVVIAHLYNEVEAKLDTRNCENSSQDAFYNALRTVSKSLGKQEHLDDGLSGIDRIIKYRSGIQLVKHFDSYINECIKSLEVDAIVLPIDDIDMALERSYEVLDVVRRLLGCPKIIPVITGDLELYEPIIQNRFQKGENSQSNCSNNTNNDILTKEKAAELTKAYLTKVIPHHNRISLEPIERLLSELEILPKPEIKEGNNYLYSDYEKDFKKCFFGPLNGEEKSCNWPKPETAREVTQLIRDLAPSELKTENRVELWQRYKVWACLKQDSIAYSDAVTAQQIEDLRDEKKHFFVTLNKLHAFNPMIQKVDLTPKWQKKNFFKDQIAKDLNTNNGLAQNMYQYFDEYKEEVIYRSMPVIEHFYDKLRLSNTSINKENIKDTHADKVLPNSVRNDKRMLLDIFTFNNYYSLGLKTQRQIFFSRAYELLSISLLNFDFNAYDNTNKRKRIRKWRGLLEDLFGRAPFYTVPALFPTKAFNISTTNDADEENNIKPVSRGTIIQLSHDIADWELNNIEGLQDFKDDSLMPILFSVFNKTFTQLRLLKDAIQKGGYSGESLSDLAIRFKYIVLNAFATFMKPAPVVLQNVGFTKKKETLRNFELYRTIAPPIRDNVGYFLDFSHNKTRPFSYPNKLLTKEHLKCAKLLISIATHPIFSIVAASEGAFDVIKDDNITAKPEVVNNNIRGAILKRLSSIDIFVIDDLDELQGIKDAIDDRSRTLAGIEANELFVKGTGSRIYSELVEKIIQLKLENF